MDSKLVELDCDWLSGKLAKRCGAGQVFSFYGPLSPELMCIYSRSTGESVGNSLNRASLNWFIRLKARSSRSCESFVLQPALVSLDPHEAEHDLATMPSSSSGDFSTGCRHQSHRTTNFCRSIASSLTGLHCVEHLQRFVVHIFG